MSSPTFNPFDRFLQSLSIEVEVAGLPPVTVDLGGEASPLVKGLRPAVTLRSKGAVITRVAPHGEPGEGFPVAAVIVGGAALGLAVLGWLALRGATAA